MATHEKILTAKQQELLRERVHDTAAWRDEADLERRRSIGAELQRTVKECGVGQGKILDHATFSRLVSLQWQIQNLNPLQMPKLLGLYHYSVHFRDFEGTEEDLLNEKQAETGVRAVYQGADLSKVSEALSSMSSDSDDAHGRGAAILLEQPGAGQALVSGFLHLLHPNEHPLVNSVSKGPFTRSGWLVVQPEQRRRARVVAHHRYAQVAAEGERVIRQIFRWQVFLEELREVCALSDFHEVDQFVWHVGSGQPPLSPEFVRPFLKEISDRREFVRVRTEAEKSARTLIEDNLGNMTSEQLSDLLKLINASLGQSGVVYTRFGPAFVGYNAGKLMEQVDEINPWIAKFWTANQSDVPKLLDQFWQEKFTGGGRAFPTAILYLRDKNYYAVWTSNLERALYSVVGGLPAKIRTGFSYIQYCERVRRLRDELDIPAELHDWLLFKVITAKTTVPNGKGTNGDKGDKPNGKKRKEITVAELAASTFMEEEFFTRLEQYLHDKQQLVFFGPPGTGKTFVAMQYARYLAQNGGEVRTIQFHPSYTYEDFMEGLRPVTSDGQLTYAVEDGIFKQFCAAARKKPASKFVLLIDEINRGNLPRILGELLLLLEHREQSIELPYSKQAFTIPKNLFLLGTMNSADRSIASLDLALRRRFHFVPMEPRTEVLLAWLEKNHISKKFKDILERLNKMLREEGIDEDRLIGHSHFMSPYLDDDFLEVIWTGTIEPILKDYFFTDPDKLEKFRLEKLQEEVAEVSAEMEDTSTEPEEESDDTDSPDE